MTVIKKYFSKKIKLLKEDLAENREKLEQMGKGNVSIYLSHTSLIINKILLSIFLNPIVVGVVVSVVFGRLYDFGYLGLKGANVRVSGKCLTKHGIYRDDLVGDQVKVATINNKEMTGVLIETREWVKCDLLQDATINRIGSIIEVYNFKKKTIASAPKLERVEVSIEQENKYAKYLKKEVLFSAKCRDDQGRLMKPLINKVGSITEIKKSKSDPKIAVITALLSEEAQAVHCLSNDIGKMVEYVPSPKKKTPLTKKELPKIKKSYIGKKLLVTGKCFPNMEVYGSIVKDGKYPRSFRTHYNLTDNVVKVIKEDVDEDNTIRFIYGALLGRPGEKADWVGAKIICENESGDILFQEFDESTITFTEEDKGKKRR